MIVAISSLITIAGLWLVLRKYITTAATLVTLLLLFLGTNFFLMTIYSGALQASILLALMVLVVWMTERWYKKPGWAETIIIGLSMGTLIFVKPAGFASFLVFLFWGAYNRESFKAKWKVFIEHSDLVLTILILFLGGMCMRLFNPQAFEGTLFCDYVTGKRAVYFLAPWLWQVLFSIKNGWLIYTPLVLFSIPGFYILAERNKKIFYSTFLSALVFVFLLASTPEITIPDNFSQAHMTEILAVLFIPIGYFVGWVFEAGRMRKVFFGLILAAVIGLNLFQTWQYRSRILNPWFTTPAYYRAVFLKTHVNGQTRMMQEYFNMDMSTYLANEGDFNRTTLFYANFENDPKGFGGHIQEKLAFAGKAAMRLDTGLRFTPNPNLTLGKLPSDYPLGIRFSAEVYSDQDYSENTANIIISLKHKDQLYRYEARSLKDMHLEKGKWNLVKLDYVIPRKYDADDELIASVWYTGNASMYVDEARVELFEQK